MISLERVDYIIKLDDKPFSYDYRQVVLFMNDFFSVLSMNKVTYLA